MLETFTLATFAEHAGQKFRMHVGPSEAIELELIEIFARTSGAVIGDARREPFSIVFRGPTHPLQQQRIYKLEHEKLGTFELFLVPIGPDKDGMRYEAVFT